MFYFIYYIHHHVFTFFFTILNARVYSSFLFNCLPTCIAKALLLGPSLSSTHEVLQLVYNKQMVYNNQMVVAIPYFKEKTS